MRPPLVTTAFVCLVSCTSLLAQELAPLHYESYDSGKEKGVVGNAGPGGSVEARGKIDLDRGTLAVFVRSDKTPEISEWSRLAGVNGMRGIGYWGMLMGFDARLEEFAFNLYDVGRYSPPLKLPPHFDRWQAGQWHHLAAVWDRFEGVTVYEDGKRVASNWGKHRWEWSSTPERIFVNGPADELYVFSECLTDAQIAQLAKGEKPTGAPIAIASPQARREHELARMGWAGASLEAMPKLESGQAMALTFARIVQMMDAKRPNAQLFEGFQDTTWPNDMYGATTRGRRAEITLAPNDGYDRVRMFVQRPYEGSLARPTSCADQTILPLNVEQAGIVHATLPAMLKEQHLVLHRARGRLGQIDLYRAAPLDAIPQAVKYSLAKTDALPVSETALALLGETPRRHWNPVLATAAPVETWALESPAFGGFQGVTDPPADAQAFDGALITLVAENLTEPTPLRVRIKEPAHGMRDWLIADVVLQPKGAGRQSFTIQLKGRPVINMPPLEAQKYLKDGKYSDETFTEPGIGFGINLVAANPVTWVMGSGGTSVAFTTIDMQQAIEPAAEDQIEFMREAYAEVMEGHAYSNNRLVPPMKWLARLAPDRVKFRQMYERIGSPKWFKDINVPKLVRPEPANDTGAPLWAFWQMQAMNEHRRVLHWFVDHKQVETGEFGGVWNDDTTHVENWLGHILCMDDSGKIADAHRKFCDGLWNYQLDQGVGKYIQDVCHFYEEGMGSLGMRLLYDYGDPTTFTRALAAASHYDKWLKPNAEGGYDYRSEYISVNGVWTMRDFANDTRRGGHKLDQMVPAGYLVWYNRHPTMAKYYRGLKPEGDGHFHNVAYAHLTDFDAARKRYTEALNKPLERRRSRELLYYIDEIGLTDEQRKLHTVEFTAPGPIEHYWGSHDTDAHFFNWKVSGDDRWLVESYKRVCEWFYSHDWLNSEAMPSMDRNPLPRGSLIRARMGSLAANRGSSGLGWPMYGLSYVKGADDVAALVTENLETRLSVRFYPFTTAPHEMQIRVWRLQPGRYTITLQHDSNDDGTGEATLWKKELTLDRGSFVDLSLPPRQSSVLSFTPIETKPFNYDRPDPAIGPQTVDPVYKEHLVVKVYNLGTKPAENVLVRVIDARSGQPVMNGEQRIARIDPPLDMSPKFQGVEFKNINANSYDHLIIEIDPDKQIDDLNPYNNRVELKF